MSVHACRAKLLTVTKQLSISWQRTKSSWKDEKSRDFENNYMTELFAAVNTADASMEKLDKLLRKVRKECE